MTTDHNDPITIELDPPTDRDIMLARRLLFAWGIREDWQIVQTAVYGTADNPLSVMKAAGTAVLGMTCYSCQTRKLDPSDKDATALELCRPCLTEAETENAHHDGYHAPDAEGPQADCALCQADAPHNHDADGNWNLR
jgi:hypothetical protein